MKKALLLFLLVCLAAAPADAQRRRKKQKEDRTERGLVYRILGTLRDKDPHSYVALFPDLDTFSTLLMEAAGSRSPVFSEMAALQENATRLLRRDSFVSAGLAARFDSLIRRGEAIGIEWKSIVPVRYELFKQVKTRDTLLEKLMPERFAGYAFFVDYSSRKTYGIALTDLFQLKDRWYGGQLGNLFEARTVDDYLAAAAASKKLYGNVNFIFIPQGKPDKEKKEDTSAVASTKTYNQVVVPDPPKEGVVLEKKYYKGHFDAEIPVQLYIRYLKGACPEIACQFEAMYLFGDQPDYLPLQVSKSASGEWLFADPRNGASMELLLDEKTYAGDWLLDRAQTGYDVEMNEVNASPEIIQKLDAILKRIQE